MYHWWRGADYTMNELFGDIVLDMFRRYVGIKRSGKYEWWIWKGSRSDIRKIQLQLSWVMGTRALQLEHPRDIVREIVNRYEEYFPDNHSYTFEYLYGNVRHC